MWGYLLWSDSVEEGLHEVEVAEEDWGSLSVVWVNVANLHVSESLWVVVGLTILSLVLWLRTKLINIRIIKRILTFSLEPF